MTVRPPWDTLVRRARPIVERVVRRVLGAGDQEHEDVVQSSFERYLAWLGDQSIRDEDRATHLAAIVARNVAVDTLRRRSLETRIFLPMAEGSDEEVEDSNQEIDGVHPERILGARERLTRFALALSAIPARSAMVIYMHDVLGLDLPEISLELGMSKAAAQSILHRGRHHVVCLTEDLAHAGVRDKANRKS